MRGAMRALLFLAFVAVSLAELWILIQVGSVIGAAATVLLVIAIAFVGASLVKYEGLRTWVRFQQALAEGRLPAGEVVDGVLILSAGALLVTPGFATDAVGLALLLPPSRALIARGLRSRVQQSLRLRTFGPGATAPPPGPGGPDQPGVVDVDVVDVERHEPPGEDREDPGDERGGGRLGSG